MIHLSDYEANINIEMSMIYALAAREQVVLCDYSPHSGNFSQVALDVLSFLVRFSPRPTPAKPSDSMPLPIIPSTLLLRNVTSS
jgi:hypothetical protein